MTTLLDILSATVSLLISAELLLFLLRSLFSFFFDGDSAISKLLFALTEPIILPVRFVLYKLNALQDTPFDWAFFITYFILAILDGVFALI